MESLEYNNYFNTSQHSYQWYGADNSAYNQHEASGPVSVSTHPRSPTTLGASEDKS